MKYIKSNHKDYKVSLNDINNIRHNLDLYDMYVEYTKEVEKKLVKIKDLNIKLDANENELMNYSDHKNKLINENEFSRLVIELKKNLDEANNNKKEFIELISKFDLIDNTKDINLKNKLINELNLKISYRKFKNDIKKANDYNNVYIDNINNKISEIEDSFNISGEDDIKINSDVIKEFNKKVSYLNSKISRNKDSINKYKKEIKGLIDELNKFLELNGYKDVNVYKNYLHNLNFNIKNIDINF